MTPERRYVLGVDRLLKVVLFALFAGVLVACLANPSTNGVPVQGGRIGSAGDVGPRNVPGQRGSVGAAVPPGEYDWVPTSLLRVQGLPGDVEMADATHVARWNDSSGNGFHATSSVTVNQPHLIGSACAFIEAGHYLGIPAAALSSPGSWTLVLWGKHRSTGAGSTIQVLWSQFGDPGNANISYFYYPDTFRVSAADTPAAGYTPPGDTDDELFIIGSDPSTGRYNYNRSQQSLDATAATRAGNGSSWMLGNWSGNLSADFANMEVKGFWLYQRRLTSDEIQIFKDNLP